MDNQTYNISRVVDGVAGNTVLPWRGFKGSTKLTINFSFPNTASHKLIKLRIKYDDASYTVYQASAIPSTLSYTIVPSTSVYLDKRYIQITLYYSNFQTYDYILPFYIAQPAAQSVLGGASVYNTQFVDTDNGGDMLVVIKSDANIYNFLVNANQIPTSTLSAVEVDVLAALSADLITINPIITEFDDNIEVIHPD